MPEHALTKVVQHLRMVAAVHAYRNLSDGDLLERFVRANDDAAFTVIIERYGPLVLGLCRRALDNLHDAEDVCQATFLVLARKASSIRKSTSLSSWLHGVACRVAQRFKRDRARRQLREREKGAPPPKNVGSEMSRLDGQSIVDEELERLPQRYRAPLILCYLDGKTRDQAARQLRLSTGSLHGRLERGRDLLRQRLTRRGLALPSALSATVLGESVTRAGLAPTLVVATTKAALAIVRKQPVIQGVIAPHVLNLTREALQSMFVAKLKLGTVAALAGLVAAISCGALASLGVAQPLSPAQALKAPAPQAPALKGETDEDFIRRISRDLRGNEPSPTEIHFFVASNDAGKREKVVDLMIQERQAKKTLAATFSADFEGTLLPVMGSQIYAPVDGQIKIISPGLKAGSPVFKDQELLRLYNETLAEKMLQLQSEIAAAKAIVDRGKLRNGIKGQDDPGIKEIREAKSTQQLKSELLANLIQRTNSLRTPGEFAVKSPLDGIVLSTNFPIQGRSVKANEPLLRIGRADLKNPKLSDWEIELKIPQKQIGQVLEAFRGKDPKMELDVDILLLSTPTRSYKGKLSKAKIASPAHPNRDPNDKTEPVMLGWVRISGSDIPEEYRLTVELLVAGTEVHARIRSRSREK